VVTLAVDCTRCAGHGLCAQLLPAHVGRDEWGFPLLHDPVVAASEARRAVAACPALALRLHTDT